MMAYARSLSIWKDHCEFQPSFGRHPAHPNNRTPLWSVFTSALGFLWSLGGHVSWEPHSCNTHLPPRQTVE